MINTTTARTLGALALVMIGPVTTPAAGRGGGASAATRTASPTTPPRPTDRAIAGADARLKAKPADPSAKKALAAAYLQKVRESADPSYYGAVDKLLTSLGGETSKDPEVLLLQGTLLLAQHQFNQALAVGKRAAAMLPENPSAQAILVDANNELGRYDDALAATQQMVDRRPDLAALSRVSYARELRGDLPGAIEAMQQAAFAGQGSGENTAYVQTLLADLLLAQGNASSAAVTYTAALRSFPGFGAARAGQAAVLYARGRPAEAARVMEEVVTRQPLLHHVIAQGDYYRAAGMATQARNTYALVDAIIALNRANGVDVDLDVAVFLADQRPTASLLATTRKALAKRPGVVGHDALAWVLHRLGMKQEAAAEIAKVVAVGDRDPVYRFHAAAIAAANGNRDEATTQLDIVLSGNPRRAGIRPEELARLATELGRTVPPPAP